MKKLFINSIAILLFVASSSLFAQVIPSPKEHFGFNIGDDYQLANYQKMESYIKKLAAVSDRVQLREVGLTEEGRMQYLMVVSSPENLKKIDRYQEISKTLALAENLTDEQARALSKEGKPVVWIDGGLHSNEMVGPHQLMETYYQLLSRDDAEMKGYLDNVIVLLWHANPDGQELLANWYMQEKDPVKRNMSIPRLYQKYIGHDNNRDFYMMNMKESSNLSRLLYVEWMPQIVYNHHQTSPAGAVVAGPPYRDPFNHLFDPMLVTGIDAVGSAMINRLNEEDKPGYTRLSGSVFSTWWNGGLRTTPYFHNMVGILTEITGNPTPMQIPVVPERLIPNNATPYPVMPQKWHFRKSIDYSLSMNFAILDYAKRNGDKLLYNIYKMGKNSIDKGSRDNWTLYPRFADEINASYEKDKKEGLVKESETDPWRGRTLPLNYYEATFKNPDLRDARGYILSSDQDDFPTAIKFVNALIKSGISVHRASDTFTVGNKNYPAGSLIIKTNQAFRPHLLDMFEPQDHPHDVLFAGGPPVKPYDAAGWTLALQMGVDFDRYADDFNGPFVKLPFGQLIEPSSHAFPVSKVGYLLSSKVNDSYATVNGLLKAGIKVTRIKVAQDGVPAGSFFVSAKEGKALKEYSNKYGLIAVPANKMPQNTVKISPARIALFDYYGGSMPSGWVRWIMEQYNFSFDVLYPQDIDNSDLSKKYDVIAFIGAGIPPLQEGRSNSFNRMPKEEDIPAEFHHLLGSITSEKSIPKLKSFLEKGGSIITVGASTNLIYHLGLPIESAFAKTDATGVGKVVGGNDYYIPTSILEVKINNEHSAAWGMANDVPVVFNNSPVFKLKENAAAKGIMPLGVFDNDSPLLSGWALGQSYLKDGVAALVAPVGKGKLYAFGPEITNRGQAHATFKLLFNQLLNQE